MKLLDYEINNKIIYSLVGICGLVYGTSGSNKRDISNKRNLVYSQIKDLIIPPESNDLTLLECILIDPVNINVGTNSDEVRLIRKDESNLVYMIYGNFVHYSNGYWRFQSSKIELIDNNGKTLSVSNLSYSTIESSVHYPNCVTLEEGLPISGNLISKFNPNNVLSFGSLQKINLIKK